MKILMFFLVTLAEAAQLFISLFFITQAVIHFREKEFISFGFDVALAVLLLALFIMAVIL